MLHQQLLGWRYSTMQALQFYREIFEIRGLIEPQAAVSNETYTLFLPLHKEVADAIVARDAAAARDAMQRLLTDTQAFLKSQLGRSRRAASSGARLPRARAAA